MKESDIQIVIERAKQRSPGARPRIVSDNGPRFIVRDFKKSIRLAGMIRPPTSVVYLQDNIRLERCCRVVKPECSRTKAPLSVRDSRRTVSRSINHYDNRRLHSAIG